MRSYVQGQRVTLTTAFADEAGVATDPTTITCIYSSPSKAVTTLVYGTDAALVRDSAGAYHVNLDTNEAGVWDYRFVGTGVVEAVDQDRFRVTRTSVIA